MSVTSICNSALMKIGAARITSVDQDDPRARDCKFLYPIQRDIELRAHTWKFAIHRVSLAAASGVSNDEFAYAFTLPSDFLRLHPAVANQENLDWAIEGYYLYTNDGGTLTDFRYIRMVEDTALMDSLFREALACKIAVELCEPSTKGLARKKQLIGEYDDAVWKARLSDSIEKPVVNAPVDPWVVAMQSG